MSDEDQEGPKLRQSKKEVSKTKDNPEKSSNEELESLISTVKNTNEYKKCMIYEKKITDNMTLGFHSWKSLLLFFGTILLFVVKSYIFTSFMGFYIDLTIFLAFIVVFFFLMFWKVNYVCHRSKNREIDESLGQALGIWDYRMQGHYIGQEYRPLGPNEKLPPVEFKYAPKFVPPDFNEKRLWCQYCYTFKEENTVHCYYCQLCVKDGHRHCCFLDTCINSKKNLLFYITIVLLILLCGPLQLEMHRFAMNSLFGLHGADMADELFKKVLHNGQVWKGLI